LEAGNAYKNAGAQAENQADINPPNADTNIVPQLGGGSSRVSKSKTSTSELKIKSDIPRGNKKATLPPPEQTVNSDDINIKLDE